MYAAIRILNLRNYKATLRHRIRGTDPWTTVEGDFVMVWGNNLAWVATDMNIAPAAEQDNGFWELVYIQQATKIQLIAGFDKLGGGDLESVSDFATSVRCSGL